MEVFSLHGDDWRLVNAERDIDIPLTVPGYALEALQKNGKIENPLYRMNESKYEWIARSEWDFIKTFNLASIGSCVDLVMDGLDTCAVITINGKQLPQKFENSYREYRIPVRDKLVSGDNEIRIHFLSAVVEAEARSKMYPYPVPCCAQGKYFHYNFVRKPACDWGWDWGPGFCPCGIYRFIEIHTYTSAYLTDIYVGQDYSCGNLRLDMKAKIACPSGEHSGSFKFSIPDLDITNTAYIKLKGPGEQIVGAGSVFVNDYQKWWPHGYGVPHLYDVVGTFTGSNGSNPSSIEKSIGLRKVELVTDPLSGNREGETFYFKINGVRVFAKGANVIPMDIIRTRPADGDISTMVLNCKKANMNMLRLWGGGVYETDLLYTTCDQLGLMVWQDAMFACGAYPRDDNFLTEVKKEIKYQAFRLGSHPCIVVWGGNNENENSLDWFPESRANKELYIVDMCKLGLDTVMDSFNKIDPYTPFLDTSPTNGLVSRTPYVKRFGAVNDPRFGDIHFYNHKDDALDYKLYPPARFVSEFGFQSYPSFSSLFSVSNPGDWSKTSEWCKFRQRHPKGNEELLSQLERHFVVPVEKRNSDGSVLVPHSSEFEQFIYLTQLQQALCYETAICYWRTLKDDPSALTGGVLYWQLNDVWQGPSWSSINYDGQWKLLHYMVCKFFAPFLVTGRINKDNRQLEVYLVNDRRIGLRVNTEVQLLRTAGSTSGSKPIIMTVAKSNTLLHADSVVGAVAISLAEIFDRFEGTNKHNCIVHVKASAQPMGGSFFAADESSTAVYTSESVIMLSPWKDMLFDDPQIQSSDFIQIDFTTVRFTLKTNSVMPHVGLETTLQGNFSDNVLLLVPGRRQEIIFQGTMGVDAVKLQESLQIYVPVQPSPDEWTIV